MLQDQIKNSNKKIRELEKKRKKLEKKEKNPEFDYFERACVRSEIQELDWIIDTEYQRNRYLREKIENQDSEICI